MGYIYKITNLVNGKVYIGQTKRTIERRFIQHTQRKQSQKVQRQPIYIAIQKYGKENFSVEELEQCDNSLLNEKEIYWIHKYKSDDGKHGYNATKGGTFVSKNICKPVDVYDLALNYIGTFESETDAAIHLGVGEESVGGCCRHKQHQAGKYICTYKGEKPKPLPDYCKKKPVYQYDLNGNFVAGYNRVGEATKKYGPSLASCLNGKLKTSYGYMWSYQKTDKILPFQKHPQIKENLRKPVEAYKLDGTFVGRYNCIAECGEKLGINYQNISGTCKGKYKQMMGYIFKFADDKTPIVPCEKRHIYKYDLDGNYLQCYETITDAKKEYGYSIDSCIHKKGKTAYGFMWRTYKQDKIEPYKGRLRLEAKQYE